MEKQLVILLAANSGYFTRVPESDVLKVQDALLAFIEDSAVFGPLLHNIGDDFDEQDFEVALDFFFDYVYSAD